MPTLASETKTQLLLVMLTGEEKNKNIFLSLQPPYFLSVENSLKRISPLDDELGVLAHRVVLAEHEQRARLGAIQARYGDVLDVLGRRLERHLLSAVAESRHVTAAVTAVLQVLVRQPASPPIDQSERGAM